MRSAQRNGADVQVVVHFSDLIVTSRTLEAVPKDAVDGPFVSFTSPASTFANKAHNAPAAQSSSIASAADCGDALLSSSSLMHQ
ncbi:MAG: hypothetical protein JWO01_729 [Microbacteriaceae bacterium]|jgi:hypothetical protein|nr:hypothetical protein [Microbacteriaceae bacterium]